MSDDANDVTKALAAFGAPSIRYHSFGQSQNRPAGVPLPRRPMTATLPLDGTITAPAPVMTQQTEPVAAPEAAMSGLASQLVPMPPLVARPMLSEPSGSRPAPLFAPAPMVAPPPRPLAEWAAPVARPMAAPIVPPMVVAPSLPPPNQPDIALPSQPMSPPVLPPVPVVPAPVVYRIDPVPVTPPSLPESRRIPSSATGAIISLPQVFDYLAAV